MINLLTDNGHSIELEKHILDRLVRIELIYFCDDCDCCNCFHLRLGITWEDIDLGLIQLEMDERVNEEECNGI